MSIAEKFEVIADAVYEKGKKDEYDKFWDAFQKYGNRTIYMQYSFAGYGFNTYNLYPKYDIKPNGSCDSLFYAWENISANERFSLKQRLEECGVVLDTSKATSFINTFAYNMAFTEVPTTDLTSAKTVSGLFAHNYGVLKTIEKLVVNENTPMGGWFVNSPGVENITIEGTIGKSGFNISPCTKLSGQSIVSIIEALSDTTSGLTVTLSQTAVDNMAFPIVGNKGTYNSWTDLEQSRTNWTISLV